MDQDYLNIQISYLNQWSKLATNQFYGIMNCYSYYGHQEFYLALGYKAEIIKEFFSNFYILNSDFTVDLSNGAINLHSKKQLNWKVTLVETGLESMTGGRIKKLRKFIGKEKFMVTYGDGLSNVDINKLIDFHNSHGKIATVTAVRPSARFGNMEIKDNQVTLFQEKPQARMVD